MTEELFASILVTQFQLIKNEEGMYAMDFSAAKSAAILCVEQLKDLSGLSERPHYNEEYFENVSKIIKSLV